MGVMIIVPAFTKGQHRNPEAVLGSIAGRKPLSSPHVSGGVHQPGRVQANDCAKEDAPQ
jgi:hypothetical protein